MNRTLKHERTYLGFHKCFQFADLLVQLFTMSKMRGKCNGLTTHIVHHTSILYFIFVQFLPNLVKLTLKRKVAVYTEERVKHQKEHLPRNELVVLSFGVAVHQCRSRWMRTSFLSTHRFQVKCYSYCLPKCSLPVSEISCSKSKMKNSSKIFTSRSCAASEESN